MKPLRRLLIWVIVALSVVVGSATAADQHRLPTFTTEQAAQQHCPGDVVVWLNTRSGVYHFKGQRWYGRDAERGVCLSERGECKRTGSRHKERAMRDLKALSRTREGRK